MCVSCRSIPSEKQFIILFVSSRLCGSKSFLGQALCKHGETLPGTTTVTIDTGNVVVVRHVPADICQNCGADYTHGDVMETIERIVETATNAGTLVEVREYRATDQHAVAA